MKTHPRCIAAPLPVRNAHLDGQRDLLLHHQLREGPPREQEALRGEHVRGLHWRRLSPHMNAGREPGHHALLGAQIQLMRRKSPRVVLHAQNLARGLSPPRAPGS
ncbi:MAG: hypothetical protein L0L28_10030, partial [Corynebacterium flavescens]|uniref:hypothetical protein n=1 Tax=Corynebacterium flavescens TaxID=28028 RepID=UPI002648FBCE